MSFLRKLWHNLFGSESSMKKEEHELLEAHIKVELLKALRQSNHLLHCLIERICPKPATGFTVTQNSEGGSMPTNNTINPGVVSNFSEVPAPAGSSLQAGNIPAWTSSDANVALTPSADGTNVNVLAAATITSTSFVLTVSGISSNGTAISTPTTVAIAAAAVPATGFTVTQNS
jgi:hypothetical protein